MKVDLKFLIEATRPDWIPQETWDGMSDADKQKMSKTEDTIQTIRNQDKNVSGVSPTSDNVQDFLRNIDRQGEEARRTGQTIADVRAREINANPNIGERLPVLRDPVTGGGSTVLVNTSRPQPTQAEAEQLAAYEASKARLAAMGPEERKAFDAKLDAERKAEQAKYDKARGEAEDKIAARRLANLSTRSGTVTLADGQTIDIDAIKAQAAKDPATSKDPQIRRQLELLQRQFNKQDTEARRAEAEETKERNRATRLKNMQQTAIQSAIAKDPSKAAELGALANYTGGSMTGTTVTTGVSKPEQAPAQSAPQSGVFGDAKNVPAPTSATGTPLSPRGGMPPSLTPKGTAEGTPTDAETHGGVQISMNKPVSSTLGRSQEDKIRIAGMRNQSLNQPILTQGVARRAVTGQGSALAATGTPSASSQGDVRYGARRATSTGVQAMAETYRFGHRELSSLLESATGSPFGGPSGWDWLLGKVKDVKKAATTKTTTAGVTTKRTLPIALQDLAKVLNPLEMKHPADRTPISLGQAGYSRAKGIRTVQQLMKNPMTNVLATLGGAPSASQLSGLVGLVKSGIGGALLGSRSKTAKTLGSGINVAGNIAQDLLASADTPEAQASRAIQAGAMLGDPRIVKDVTVSDVVRYRP